MGDPLSMAAISATFQVLFEKVLNTLSTYTLHEYRLLLGGDDQGVNQDLTKLQDTLIRFRRMVRDDELKIFKNKETRDWYGSVRCAVNEADIILEDPLDSDSDDCHKKRVCNPFPTLLEFSVRKRNKFGKRIASLLQKFESLEVQRIQLNFDVIDLTLNRETMSTSSEVVFGRNDEKEQIVKFLLSDASTQSDNGPRIYSILGLGGIGKTTLARLICNDMRVGGNFESIIWVWVSQTFDVKKVMETIIETHSKETRTFQSLQATQDHLIKLLTGKKYLLVLDDMWNERQEEWDKLMSSLNSGASGSSILLTTRGADVASTARAHYQHKITLLSEEQCWNVFKESAFLEGIQENGMLEVVGKQIAKKCGGLPLAAKCVGGSLRLTREVYVWESTRDSDIWELPKPCDILPALKLSLDSLDSHVRDCFSFCCVFPKGHKMLKKDLIELWMANDFFPSHKILEPEDVGNRIFTELVMKSFFEISYEYHGIAELNYIRSHVQMHDLMHDLAFSFGNQGFCWEEDQDVSIIPSGVLHLSCHPSTTIKFRTSPGTNILDTLSKYLPSLCTWNSTRCDLPSEMNFKNLNCLRALSLKWYKLRNLPTSIGKIKQLKYLSLSGCTGVTHLPDSVCNLTNLQTLTLNSMEGLTLLPEGISKLVHLRNLDLSKCSSLTHLPDGIAGLVNLRCIYLIHCPRLTHLPDGIGSLINLRHLTLKHHRIELPEGDIMSEFDWGWKEETNCKLPNGIGQLVNLQNLDYFVVDEQIGRRITELQGMNQLSGGLEIRGLEHVRDREEAESVFLKNKTNLSSLELIWGDSQISNSIIDEAKAEGVLEALWPPSRLNEKLAIDGYGGSVFPSWMGLLQNLVRIELRNCIKCVRLPPLGQLSLLKFLVISEMESLECINTEFYGSSNNSSERRCVIFPSLEKLDICNLPNLKEWKDLEIMMDNQQTDPCPCLIELRLSRCPNLISLPSLVLSLVQELKIEDCDKVIRRSLPCHTSLVLKGKATNGATSFPNGSLQNLDALEYLEIRGYSELTCLPDELSNLASLKRLEIYDCPALQSLSESLQNLSTLEFLVVCNCEQLELSSEDFQGLISVEDLSIDGLPKLMSLHPLQHLSTLKSLSIRDCEQLELSSEDFQGLISLHTLKIDGLPKLTSLPRLQHLSTLKSLRIQDCEQLELSSANFQGLISVEYLFIGGLPKLTSLDPLQHLSTLKDLEVRRSKNVIRLWPRDGNNLTAAAALETLWIEDCEQLELLASDFQHLVKLRKIELVNLPKLTTSLPELHHLHSLRRLEIVYCKHLRVLPQGLHNLTSLESLWIDGCHSELHSRCKEDTGDYWPSIQHIPSLCIMNPHEETRPITPCCACCQDHWWSGFALGT